MHSYEMKNRRSAVYQPDSFNGRLVEETPILLTEEELSMYDLSLADPVGAPGHDGAGNMILSKDMRLAIDSKQSNRNLSTIIYGYGSDEAFFEPNILQGNMSYVIEDEGGRYFNTYSQYLKKMGYSVYSIILGSDEELNLHDIFKSYGTKKSAFFLIHMAYETERRMKQMADFFESVMKVLSYYREEYISEKRSIHTMVMIPHFYKLSAIESFRNSTGLSLLSKMHRNRVSLNIGTLNANLLPVTYPDTYTALRDKCDTLIYLGNDGYDVWNRERQQDPGAYSFLMDDSCLVSVRGVQSYVDKKYNLLDDERYKLVDSCC